MFYVLFKVVHIISMLFFVGVVSFRTFIIPVLKTKFNKHMYLSIDKIIGLRARSIIKVNNILLIASGLYLLSLHVDSLNVLLVLKVALGLLLASSFYVVPMIMKKFNHIKWFSQFLHYLFFGLMILVIMLSQIMFM